jgi:hypothetical protein
MGCDNAVRSEGKRVLARCEDPGLANHLFEMLEDPSAATVHAEAADLLGTIEDACCLAHAVETRPHAPITCNALLRLRHAPRTRTRRGALRGLLAVHSPFDIERICPWLWDADFHIRRLAMAILTRHKVPQTLQLLSRALKDEVDYTQAVPLALRQCSWGDGSSCDSLPLPWWKRGEGETRRGREGRHSPHHLTPGPSPHSPRP